VLTAKSLGIAIWAESLKNAISAEIDKKLRLSGHLTDHMTGSSTPEHMYVLHKRPLLMASFRGDWSV
jgi:hypothetical protein